MGTHIVGFPNVILQPPVHGHIYVVVPLNLFHSSAIFSRDFTIFMEHQSPEVCLVESVGNGSMISKGIVVPLIDCWAQSVPLTTWVGKCHAGKSTALIWLNSSQDPPLHCQSFVSAVAASLSMFALSVSYCQLLLGGNLPTSSGPGNEARALSGISQLSMLQQSWKWSGNSEWPLS